MTIEKLLGMSADQLDKLTKPELEAYFAPFLQIVRPAKVEGNGKKDKLLSALDDFDRDLERKLRARGMSMKDLGL